MKDGIPGLPKNLGKIDAKEMQLYWDNFFSSASYRDALKRRILSGRAPHMEVMLHHMTYGKPKETLALSAEGDGIFILQIGDTVLKKQVIEGGNIVPLEEVKVPPALTEGNGGR